MNKVIHQVEPLAVKSSYTENEIVDFVLDFEGRMMNLNSIRLNGKLKVMDNGGNRIVAQDVKLSHSVGLHSVISSITTELQNGGVIENIGQDYPRLVKTVGVATLKDGDYNMSNYVCEGRFNTDVPNQSVSQGQVAVRNGGNNANVAKDFEFSIKPMICLNRATGGNLSYNKSGSVRLSFNLEKNLKALNGVDCGTGGAVAYASNGMKYELSDLKVSFYSDPDDGSNNPIQMRTTQIVKSVLSSATANVSSKVPMMCVGVSCSFLSQSSEFSFNLDTNAMEQPENIRQVQFLFNNASNQYISYALDSIEEIMSKGIDSIANTGHTNAQLSNLKANDAFILGCAFDDIIDLSNQQFNIQITSDITNANPFLLYQIFHGVSNL